MRLGGFVTGTFRPVNFCGKPVFFPLAHRDHRMMKWSGVEETLKTI